MTAQPPLFCLPGAGADPDVWRPVGARLPAAWLKTYVAWPGLGRQPPSPAVTGIEDLVDLVEARLPAEPVDLLAQSMGGVVALRLALRRPTRIRRLVLAVTSGGLPMASLGALDWRAVYRRTYPEARLSILDDDQDLSAVLGAAAQPALLLWGGADPISPTTAGRRLLERLPNARLHIVPDADHDLISTHADAVAPLVQAHLEADGGGP